MIGLFQYNRIAAAFIVLLIHLPFQPSTPFVSGLKNSAVPLFACMAGYLYKGEIGKKFGRIFIPYCIWAVVYFLANNVLFDVLVKRQQFCFPGLDAWLLGGTAAHLWFLPSLLAAFALASVVRLFGATGVRSRLAWGGVLLALGAATQFLPANALGSVVDYVRLYFGRLLLFFSIGWMLRPLLQDRWAKATVVVGGICTVVGLVNLALGLLSGLSWRPLLFVVGMMILSVGCGTFRVPRTVERLAANTMGIYLVHLLFTSVAAALLARCGYARLSVGVGLPLALVLFFMSYTCARILPKWMKG